VPYIPYYAFEELLSPFIDDPADKLSVLRAMVQICDYLTDSEVSKFDLIISSKKKEEVLRKFALAPDEEESAEAKPAQADATLKKQLEQADEFFAQLTEDEKGAARRLWTRLVRVPRDDERALNSGVVVPLDDLDPTVLHLARELTEAKLLVINKDDLTGEATVGVANEELLRQWPQLIAWINKDREFLIWRQKLSEHIAQWEKDKRSRLSLLGVSAALRAQERLRERPADLTSVEKDYIERSTRQRLLLLGASAVAACVVVAALLVFWVYNKRQAQARVATRLSSAVEQFNVDDPKADLDLGMLLAVESLRVSGDVKAERLLRENITKFPLSVANLHHDTRVDSVTFSGDGGRLTTVSGAFSGSMDSSTNDSQKLARVWDISSGQELARLSLDPAAQDFAVNSDGRYVAVTGTERAENATVFKVLLYDLSAPDSQPVKVNSHSETISAMTFGPSPGPDGRILLATASEDGTVHVFDVSGMKQLATLTYSSAVISLAFGSSRYLVTGTDDNRINTCDLNALGARGGSLELDGNILMVASSPNDKYMAALLLKVPRAREALLMIRPIKDSTDVPLGVSNLNDLTFSSDSHYVAAAGEDGLGHIFSLADGKAADGKTEVIKIASLRHGSAINKMIFSGDGKYVATIGHDKVARVWETATGHESFRLTLEGEVNDLAFSPDGQYVAVASADRTARVWRVTGSGGSDVAAEACKRLSRNLTPQEWSRYFDDQPYRKTCENLP
jgi:WD40 repeat protein